MVSEKKISEVKELVKLMEKYPVIGIVDLFKTPSKQLQKIRKSVRGSVLIKMVKKSIMKHAIEEVKKENLKKLNEFDVKKPAIVFTELDSFKLSRLFEKNKSSDYANEGDIAPYDIVVHEGPTKLPAGPAIGELQRAKIPAMVKEGKIHVSKDTVVVKKNKVITAEIANILKKLEIQPIEIGINLIATWENGIVFDKSVLGVSEEEFIGKLVSCYNYALNLAVNIEYPTIDSIKVLLQKAYLSAKSVNDIIKSSNQEVSKMEITKEKVENNA